MSYMTKVDGSPDSSDAIPGMAYFTRTGPPGWDTRANNIIDDFRSGVRKRGSVSRGTVPGNSYARRTAA